MVTRNKRIRFMDNQLITSSNVTTSLIVNNFPFSNMLEDGRFRLTEFDGTFTIVNTNSSLHFNTGSDVSVQIPVGDYNSATLCTEIQTQMNSVSGGWTCSYSSSTYKFTLARASGTKILKLTNQSNAIWDTIGFTGLVDQDASEADEQRNHTKEYIEIDLGTNANEVGFFGLLSPASDVFPVSENATIELLASNLQNWDSPARTMTVDRDDLGLYKFLDDGDAAYRYWRLEITDRLNTAGPGFTFSNIYLGTYTTLGARNVNAGFNKRYVDPSSVVRATSGATYANIRQRYVQIDSLTMNYMDQSDRLNLEQLYYDFGIHKPFWISLDPTEDCSDITELTRYVYFTSDPVFNHFRSNIYSMSFSVRDAL